MMIPSVGRTVHYTISDAQAKLINERRAESNGIYYGNQASAGQVYPMLITRVWDAPTQNENSAVQGQVFLDGNDTFWVTSGHQGEGEYYWFEPPRV